MLEKWGETGEGEGEKRKKEKERKRSRGGGTALYGLEMRAMGRGRHWDRA